MTKTYYEFSGSDFVLICNGKVYGDMFTFRADSIKKTIELDFSLFNSIENTDAELRSIDNGRFVEVFINEHGDKVFKCYTGIKYIGYKINHSIDDKIIKNTFIFNYESDTPFKNLEEPFTDLIEKEKELSK